LPNEESLGIQSRFLRAPALARSAPGRFLAFLDADVENETFHVGIVDDPGRLRPSLRRASLTPTPRRDRAASRPRRRTLARTRADPRSLSRLDPTAAPSSRPGAHARRKSNNDAARLAILLLPST